MPLEKIQLVLSIINLTAIIAGTFLVLRQVKAGKDVQFTELWMRAEKDFDELNKLMLSDKELRDTYRLDDPVLEKVDDSHLRKFIFYELYYGHIARVFAMFKSPLNPYHGKKQSDEYWGLYRRMLKYYLRDPIFKEVHESAKEMGTFENTFISEVDSIIKSNDHN